MADGGRREKKGKSRDGGALGLLIGRRATGRGEWRLGEVDLVRGDSTASGRSEQAALRMAGRRGSSGGRLGRVLAWEGAKGQARWRWRASLVHLAADAPWTRSTGGVRRAAGENRASREERDGGEGIFAISKSSGTSR